MKYTDIGETEYCLKRTEEQEVIQEREAQEQ